MPSYFSTHATVLDTTHTIFRLSRTQRRSNTLSLTINLGVSKLLPPFTPLSLARCFPTPPAPPAELAHGAQSTALFVEPFYCLYRTLPPQLEDGTKIYSTVKGATSYAS
jgi:hypothetical protein